MFSVRIYTRIAVYNIVYLVPPYGLTLFDVDSSKIPCAPRGAVGLSNGLRFLKKISDLRLVLELSHTSLQPQQTGMIQINLDVLAGAIH